MKKIFTALLLLISLSSIAQSDFNNNVAFNARVRFKGFTILKDSGLFFNYGSDWSHFYHAEGERKFYFDTDLDSFIFLKPIRFPGMGAGGGSGTPGGTDQEVQFNDGGVFGGSDKFLLDKTSGSVSIFGYLGVANLVGNTLFNVGVGATPFVYGGDLDGAYNGSMYAIDDGDKYFFTQSDSVGFTDANGTPWFKARINDFSVGFGDFSGAQNHMYFYLTQNGTFINGSLVIASDGIGNYFSAGDGDVSLGVSPHDVTYRISDRSFTIKSDSIIGTSVGGTGTRPLFATPSGKFTASGNLPIANFNSGTGASASTYWTGNGTWTAITALPSMTGNSGKFVTTNGAVASWALPPINSISNLSGIGVPVYKTTSSNDAKFKRLKSGEGINVTDQTDSISFSFNRTDLSSLIQSHVDSQYTEMVLRFHQEKTDPPVVEIVYNTTIYSIDHAEYIDAGDYYIVFSSPGDGIGHLPDKVAILSTGFVSQKDNEAYNTYIGMTSGDANYMSFKVNNASLLLPTGDCMGPDQWVTIEIKIAP